LVHAQGLSPEFFSTAQLYEKVLSGDLMRHKRLESLRYFWCTPKQAAAGRRIFRLISLMQLYLTGFLKYRNRPETAKIMQKSARSRQAES
jgi:hypothetical protein